MTSAPAPRRGRRVTVLLGGTSPERAVSLASGAQLYRALREWGHEVLCIDTARGILPPAEVEELLSRAVGSEPPPAPEEDLLASGALLPLLRDPTVAGSELLFPILHGGTGEDGTLQAVLDLAGIPYAGSGRLGCTLAMDKEVTKRLLRSAGIATPDWLTEEASLEEVEAELGFPVIVKPPSGGSTIGLTLAHDAQELRAALAESRRHEDRVLFERYVKGRELTVGILGETPLPVGEIVPAHELFDYECKYTPGMAEEIFPADLPAEVADEARARALAVHRLLFLRDFSRVDFLLDDRGELWCLEANALPGMTALSLLPRAARAEGLSFEELCNTIVDGALRRVSGGH